MELTFTCPQCQSVGRVLSVEQADDATCRACGAGRELRREAFDNGQLVSCAWCATNDLYVQKDFPQGLGLAILAVGFAISTVFWYYMMLLWTFGVLLASVFLDWWMYHRVPNVTICYRCLSQYRGPGANPDARFRPFDLAIGERYRQERLRVEEIRGAAK